MSSVKFAEQIKALEEEGAKLLAETHSLGDSLNISKGLNKSGLSNTSALDLSALTDYTAEQKTINHLRHQLESQCQETARLLGSGTGSRTPTREPARSSSLANLDIPITTTTLTGSSPARAGTHSSDYKANVSDRQLRDAQNESSELRTRLKEALSVAEQQKAHFRSTIEDLRAQLQNAVSARDALLNKTQRDMTEKDDVVGRLQETVAQLERANKLQEDTLLDMNNKLEGCQKEKYIVDTAVNQIREVLLERERKRGRVFYENEPIARQSVTMLVHSLERAFHDVEFDVNHRQEKIDQLLLELDDMKLKHERKEDQIILEYERKMTSQRDELGLQMSTLSEQVSALKERTTLLQEQKAGLTKQLDHQVRTRDEQIDNLERRLRQLRQEHTDEQAAWAEKRTALEQALDETQKELAITRGDKDAAIRRTAQVESRFTDMQMNLDRLTGELSSEQDKFRTIQESERRARAAEERLSAELKHKDTLLSELQDKVAAVKQQADAKLQTAISSMEKEGRAYIEKEMSSLKTQLQTMTEKCHAQQLELELTKSELNYTKEKLVDTKAQLDKTAGQLELTNTKQQSLTSMLSDKVAEVERINADKTRLERQMDEQTSQVNALKALREKLTMQLEEREKNFLQLQQQNDRIAQLVETNSSSTHNVREERDTLQQRFNEKIIETEELRKTRDLTTKKLRMREKRLHELEEANKALESEVGERKAELGAVSKEKDKLFEELKQSRYEVASLKERRSQIQMQLEQIESTLERERSKMNRRLKSSEHDLKLHKKALRTKEHVDNSAVKVAGDMQKEVTAKRGQIDSLQTRMRWLEECLDAALKDKKCVEEEKEELHESIERKRKQCERLTAELSNATNSAEQLKQRIKKLEGALEKAAVKNGALESRLEQQEQEVARLKLTHQLEMKELKRQGKIKTPTSRVDTVNQPIVNGNLGSSVPSASAAISQPHTATANSYTASTYVTASKPPPAPARPTHTASSPLLSTAYTPSRQTLTHSHAQPLTDTADEVPVRDIPANQAPRTEANELTGELRDLMREMRSVLDNQCHLATKTSLSDTVGFSDSELEHVGLSLRRRGSGPRRRYPRKNASTNPAATAATTHRRGGGSGRRQREVSPVSDLLLTFDDIQSDSCLLSNDSLDETTNTNHYRSMRDISPRGVQRVSRIAPVAEDVCKRLERKIASLTQMGSKLQHDHLEMAKVMEDQDRKLKKVKSQMQ